MRTTILLSSLLFLAGYALAQDSPITVGDSSSQPPLPGTKAGTRGHSTYLQHKHFTPNGDNYYVADKGYKAACFEVSGAPRPPILLDRSWTLVLSDGIVLTTTDGNRVDIVYSGKPIDKSTTTDGDVHKAVDDQLTSGWLINGGQATKYPTGGATSPLEFQIHYCPGGACGNLCK
jgi:hypothetical protein